MQNSDGSGGRLPPDPCRAFPLGRMVVLLALLVVPGPAGSEERDAGIAHVPQVAAAAPADSIPTSSGRGLRSPFWVMMRSAAVPGWGQLTNRKVWKAAVVAGAEGYLLARLVRHESARRDALERSRDEPDQAAFWEARAERERMRRNDFTWWTALAVFISMGDAFVDAHLRYFDAEFDAMDAGEDEPVVEYKVGVRLTW